MVLEIVGRRFGAFELGRSSAIPRRLAWLKVFELGCLEDSVAGHLAAVPKHLAWLEVFELGCQGVLVAGRLAAVPTHLVFQVLESVEAPRHWEQVLRAVDLVSGLIELEVVENRLLWFSVSTLISLAAAAQVLGEV